MGLPFGKIEDGKRCPFDVKTVQHIEWSSAEELRRKVADAIEFRIGRGRRPRATQ